MMPGLDGWEVLRKIRQRVKMCRSFLTARDGVDDRVKGLELGADDYLVKPLRSRSCWLGFARCCAEATVVLLKPP
jgi:DNA-binding response OmpR family regulator